MIIIKIIFWLYFAKLVIYMMYASGEHPRKNKPVNLGGDLTTVLMQALLSIWLGLAIWMPHIFDK